MVVLTFQNWMNNILEHKLEEISELKDGWIPGSIAIQPKAIEFTKVFLDIIKNHENWDIAPFVNGSIMLTYRTDDICCVINVATLGISAFIEGDDLYETITLHYNENSVMTELIDFLNKYLKLSLKS